jgi:hypothetical protein
MQAGRIYRPEHTAVRDLSVQGSDLDRSLKAAGARQPVIKTAFPGIGFTGSAAPDSILAVGPSRIMFAVNTDVAIFTKTGKKRFQTSFENWFKPLESIAGGANLFDPKVIYDQYNGHFIFLCDARRADKRSWYLLSVSHTSDPEGEWSFYAMDMQLNGGNRVTYWADLPRIGFDQNAVYLTGNMTAFRTYAFQYAKIRILKKSELYAFGNLTWRDFWKFTDGSGEFAYSVEPVHSYGPASVEYFVNTRELSGNTLTLFKMTNAATNQPLLSKINIPVSSYSAPPGAEQKGGGITLYTGDAGVINAVARGGKIITALATGYNWGSGLVSAVRFYEITTSGRLLKEVTYGNDKLHYYFPVVMYDKRGNLYMAFCRSGKTEFAGIYFTGRPISVPGAGLQPAVALQKGLTNFQQAVHGTTLARWGDFNGIALDGDDSVWIYSQFASSKTQWATTAGKIRY